jgi:hypothetical protein
VREKGLGAAGRDVLRDGGVVLFSAERAGEVGQMHGQGLK